MDVFSRKAWCYPMKTKGLSDTTPAIKKFFSESGLHKFIKEALVIIMSDSDSAFKGDDRDEEQNFQKVLSNNNAVLEHVNIINSVYPTLTVTNKISFSRVPPFLVCIVYDVSQKIIRLYCFPMYTY
jgi:hypothetical protein